MWLLIANSLLLGLGLAMDAFSVSVANGLDNPRMSKGRHMSIALIFALFQMAMPMIGWVLVVTVADRFAVFDRCVPYIALVLLVGIGIKMIVDSAKEIRRSRQEKTGNDDQSSAQDVSISTIDNDTNTASVDSVGDIEAVICSSVMVADDNGDALTIDNTTEAHTIVLTDNEIQTAAPAVEDKLSTNTAGQAVQQDGATDTAKKARKLGVWGLLVQALATSIDALSVGFTIAEYNWAQALLCAGIIGIVTLVLCMLGVWIGRKAGGRFAGKAGIVGGVILIAIGIEIFVSGLL